MRGTSAIKRFFSIGTMTAIGLLVIAPSQSWGQSIGDLQKIEQLQNIAFPSENTTANNNSVNGTIDQNSYTSEENRRFNIHTFEGQAGEQITIELTSNDFDPLLIVLDPKDELLANDDNSGSGENAMLTVTLPSTGTYKIGVVSTQPEQMGNYSLNWREASTSEQNLAENSRLHDSIHGKLDGNSETIENRYFNVHTFEGKAGEQVTVTLQSAEFDSILVLMSPENEVIADDDGNIDGKNAQITITLPSDGIYKMITIAMQPGQLGNYTLSWQGITAAEN